MSENIFRIKHALDSMKILVDTREQPGARFNKRVSAFGNWERATLSFGDYSVAWQDHEGNWHSMQEKVAIERKMDANELAGCFGKERSRFKREFERAKSLGARMYVIVENETWEKIIAGKYGSSPRYRSKYNPKALKASILAYACRYDVHWHFCKQESSGELIKDILYYELKEYLENKYGENEQGSDD